RVFRGLAAPQVGELRSDARLVDGEQVVAAPEEDARPPDGEARLRLALDGARELLARARRQVVDEEVAVALVDLVLEGSVVDVLAVAPAREQRPQAPPLLRRYLHRLPALAAHLEERVGREAARRVPVEVERL